MIGAGPAGLLFTLIGKILIGEAWSVTLFDKRASYVRTHRLRIDPVPYRAIQAELNDKRFDALIAFLEENDFTPEVNLLEAKLSALLSDVGVTKTIREVTTLADLGDVDTIVGADSVHSTIRDLVRDDIRAEQRMHERVVRLRVSGADLPTRLGIVDQFRLSKVLGSLVDYRVNKNGYAEVDLFVTEREHEALRVLGASPKEPVAITSRSLSKVAAPFMRAVVEQLEGEERTRTIVVQSTFVLEHVVMPKLSFAHGNARVFLVGDAGISLPFFRGMACLASCAHALARTHASRDWPTYDEEVARIAAREIGVVRARARVIRLLRELVRLSSLLPFPIQSWWLSAARDPEPDRLSKGTGFNIVLAVAATAATALFAVSPWLALFALPVQIAGGAAYRWTLDLEPGPHRYLRRVWELQIAFVGVAGAALAFFTRTTLLAAFVWWLLGAAFAAGIYLFERVVARALRGAS